MSQRFNLSLRVYWLKQEDRQVATMDLENDRLFNAIVLYLTVVTIAALAKEMFNRASGEFAGKKMTKRIRSSLVSTRQHPSILLFSLQSG